MEVDLIEEGSEEGGEKGGKEDAEFKSAKEELQREEIALL